MHDPRIPNFFIIGAPKSGTTTLYDWLRQHPDVYLSFVKEPRFFCEDDKFAKGIDFYLDTYFKGASGFKARGEATPHYLYFERVARRIKENTPESCQRFIVILRNPIERAYSLYWDMVANGSESLDFESALEQEGTRIAALGDNPGGRVNCQYVDSGLYAKQLKNWFQHFDQGRFLILFQDDLKSNPTDLLAKVFDFLALDPVAIETDRRSNPAGVSRSNILASWLSRPSRLKKGLGRLLPFPAKYRLVKALRAINKRPLGYPPMAVSTCAALKGVFEDDVQLLEEIADRDLSDWLQE